MEEQALKPVPGGVILRARVQPRASRAYIKGFSGGALKVYLTAPPEKGRANGQCLELMAGALGLSPKALSILSGEKARLKRIRIIGITPSEALDRISAAIKGRG